MMMRFEYMQLVAGSAAQGFHRRGSFSGVFA